MIRKNMNPETMLAALMWLRDLNHDVISDLTMGRALLDRTHDAKRDKPMEDWVKELEAAVRSAPAFMADAPNPMEGYRAFATLVAALSVRMLEQFHAQPPKEEDTCGCMSCQMRRHLESMGIDISNAEVRVVDDLAGFEELLANLRRPGRQR